MFTRPPLAPLLALVLGLTACDSSQVERVEAQRLIAAYEALTAAVGQSGREARLEALGQLPLRREAPRKARDLCVDAHRALLDAESEQEKASAMLEQAIAGKGGDPLDPDQIAPIQATIERSELSLKSARGRFGECEAAIRDLALRYDKRR